MIKYSTDTAGICGLFCGTCPSFPEECEGCFSNKLAADCVECQFKSCAKEKGVARCYECSDFPCQRLADFIPIHVVNGIVHHENVINDLLLMKKIGVQSWVDDQVKANTCAACREMIHWHEIHTHKCRI